MTACSFLFSLFIERCGFPVVNICYQWTSSKPCTDEDIGGWTHKDCAPRTIDYLSLKKTLSSSTLPLPHRVPYWVDRLQCISPFIRIDNWLAGNLATAKMWACVFAQTKILALSWSLMLPLHNRCFLACVYKQHADISQGKCVQFTGRSVFITVLSGHKIAACSEEAVDIWSWGLFQAHIYLKCWKWNSSLPMVGLLSCPNLCFSIKISWNHRTEFQQCWDSSFWVLCNLLCEGLFVRTLKIKVLSASCGTFQKSP